MLGKFHNLPKLARRSATSATTIYGQLTIRATASHGHVSTIYRCHTSKIGSPTKHCRMLHKNSAKLSWTALDVCCRLDDDLKCLEPDYSVLDQVRNMSDQGCFQSGCVPLMLERLLQMSYANLVDNFEWLQKNMNIAYIQLLLSGNLETIMAPIQEHTNFPHLVELIIERHKSFTNLELVNCLVALLYLATPQVHPVVTILLMQCRKCIPLFDFPSLAAMSTVVKTLPGIDPLSSRQLVQRHRTLLADADHEWTTTDLVAHCQLMLNLMLFSSPDLLLRSARSLKKVLLTVDIVAEPDNLGTYVRTAQKIFTFHKSEKLNARNILATISKACHKVAGQLEAHHIAEICHALRKARCYDSHIAAVMEKRAYELLLCTNCKLRDISNLFYALTRQTPSNMKSAFEEALLGALNRTDVDVVILSNLADSLGSIGPVNRKLVLNIHQLVANKADHIVAYMSRYQKIVRFLIHKRFRNKEHEFLLKEKLLDYVNKREGIHMYSMPFIAAFILPTSYDTLPEKFYRKLLQSIPHWSAGELYRLAVGLNSMRQPMTGQLRRQVSMIQNYLYQNIAECVNSISSYDQLYQLTLGLAVQNRNHDPSLTEKLMRMYTSFSRDLNDVSLMKTAQVFSALSFYLPRVYEDMVQMVLCEHKSLDFVKIMLVLNAIAQVSYQPKQMEEFVNVVLMPACARLREENKLAELLAVMKNLSQLQVFPVEQLTDIFQLGFLEDMDQYMEDVPQQRRNVERAMMVLNRDVVLECPQLDVPWFHEAYGKENAIQEPRTTASANSRFRDEIDSCLTDYLGDKEYFSRWVYSPYYHVINFQCLLDDADNPIAVGTQDEIGLQKVAILTLTDQSYCYNSKRLTGKEMLRKRQLEIMGYRVAEIPHFEWYSMALADWQAKVDYLQSKIGNP